jgi:ubiquinone/menaquinone biosynthesis C-methylase UbiE
VAQAWDLLRGDTSEWPDRAFYRALIEQNGGSALDIGCGTGRLLLNYLAAGLDIDGVDNSPEMLALCRNKAEAARIDVRNRLHEQAMETLALARRYATIIVPSSSFQLVTDPAAARVAMARLHDHLEPGGLLVMSIMSKLWRGKAPPPQMQWSAWHSIGERVRPEDRAVVRRMMRVRYDHEQQLEHEENLYEVLRDGVVVESELHERSPSVRWYSQAQAIAGYENAGFADVRATSGFTFEPVQPEDTTFCVLGRRR